VNKEKQAYLGENKAVQLYFEGSQPANRCRPIHAFPLAPSALSGWFIRP